MNTRSNKKVSKEIDDIYQSIFDYAGEAMYLMQDNSFVNANQALFTLFGCTAEQLFERAPSDFSPDFQPNGISSWNVGAEKIAAVLTGAKQNFEFTFCRLDGVNIQTEVTLNRIVVNGEIYILAIVRDMSDLKSIETEIILSRKRIIEQNKGLSLLNELSNQLQGSYNEAEIYEKTIDTIAKILPNSQLSIFKIDRPNKLLYLQSVRRHKSEDIEKFRVIPLNPHFQRIADETGNSIDIPSIEKNDWIFPNIKEALLNMGFQSMVIVPFVLKNERSALMYLIYDEVGGTNKQDMKVLNSISKTVSLALDNAHTHSELDFMAHHDSLTGLGNRAYFHKEFKAKFNSDISQNAALYLLDLDRFKEINDTLGHFTGDKLLQKIGPRLENEIGDYEFFVSRLGGDEFTIFVYGIDKPEQASSLAEDILKCLRIPFEIDDVSLEIDSSIGIALYPKDGEDSHALLRSADVAMYQAKKNSKGYKLYEPDTDVYTPERLTMIAEFGYSVKSGQLYLHYQPKLDLQTNKILGFEALVRWKHPSLGSLSPSIFVPLIETSNSIFQLTEEVLHQALKQEREWRRNGYNYTVAINLSARNLLDDRIINLLRNLLEHYKTPKNSLELEITETALMQDTYRASNYLKQICDLGIQLSIDDFGTGYSSLAYLKKLPVNKIKLDREFIMDMLDSLQGDSIVRTIIHLSKELNMLVLAEGVEDIMTLNKLRNMGCDQAQGYYICKPNDWVNIENWLKETKTG